MQSFHIFNIFALLKTELYTWKQFLSWLYVHIHMIYKSLVKNSRNVLVNLTHNYLQNVRRVNVLLKNKSILFITMYNTGKHLSTPNTYLCEILNFRLAKSSNSGTRKMSNMHRSNLFFYFLWQMIILLIKTKYKLFSLLDDAERWPD